MEDFITALLDDLSERRTLSDASGEYVRRLQQEESACRALSATFTQEQEKLFFAYDNARNAAASLSEWEFARNAFLLAREIYR